MLKPPVCHDCLYPPDKKRRLLFFQTPEEMILYLSGGKDSEVYWPDPEAKPVALECPSYQCSVGAYVGSIEELARQFNWFAEEIDKDHPDYIRRLIAGKINSRLKLIELFKNGEPVE